MNRKAFSLIEALVVMAVLSLLIGLLAPALASVRAGARSAQCQLNLKQMAAAAYNYAAVFDAFPAAIRYEKIDGVYHHIAWDFVTKHANQVVSPGALWMFTTHPGEVMQCPDYHGIANFGEPFTGYNYNTTYIGAEAASPLMLGWKKVRKGVSPHACSRASQCAMFGDAGKKNQANKYMRAPLRTEGPTFSMQAIYSGGQAFRHAGATNIAFVDGHVGLANSPCKGKLATPELLDQFMDFPGNGFLSDDDSRYDPR